MDNIIGYDIEKMKSSLYNVENKLDEICSLLREQTTQLEKLRYFTENGTMDGFCVGWEDGHRNYT